MQSNPGLDPQFIWCDWEKLLEDKEGDCRPIFRYVWSEEGVCYTFNMVDDKFIYRDHV